MHIDNVQQLADNIKSEIAKAVIGQSDTIEMMLIAMLSGGHILLEGVPGTAKTFLANVYAQATNMDFGRIQFTPDLMPGDLLGTNIFNFQTNEFHRIKGPIFCDLLLADEINRTPPKTQAALLEAMQERKVTIDGDTFDLGEHFMVIATQNPIEQQGTYPLPEAQLDRFIFKHVLNYPTREEEIEIVTRHGHHIGSKVPRQLGIKAVAKKKDIKAAAKLAQTIHITEDITHYIVDLVRATRNNPMFETGASPRAATMIAAATRARAVLNGRDYAIPDDVKAVALPALRHRAILSPAAEIEGHNADAVITSIIEQTHAPR